MITFLSGGTGTPKLIRGMRSHLADEEIAVVVNTAEDLWISGNHLSPDLDTLIYLFSGSLDTNSWWGIREDTFRTHEEALRMGVDEFIAIGDADRAIHIARGELLRQGCRFTEVTDRICRTLGVRAQILPMADTPVSTVVRSHGREYHYQEYWVRHRGEIPIESVERKWEVPPVATGEVIAAVRSAEAVVIGPSNPITSILPILECAGIREAMSGKMVISISPFIGNAPVSGPAAALMQAWGCLPDSLSTHDLYREVSSCFIHDLRDPVEVPGSYRLDTLMKDLAASTRLCGEILSIIRGQ